MIKRVLLTLTLSLTLTAGFASVPSVAQETQATSEEQVSAYSQKNVEGDWVDSKEVNTVEESPIAQQMTQEEKANNIKANDSWGGAITIMAMCIVLVALIVLSVLFFGFGKISSGLHSRKKLEARGLNPEDIDDDHEHVDSGEVIAAIAAALDEHFNNTHDMEAAILTLKRMKRAYSPWNSKIYNMREVPQLRRNRR